jgi:plastocyanin
MRVRHLAPFFAGLLAAFAAAGLPASAADQAIFTSGTSWTPANVSIGVNEKVTWSDATGIHNLYIEGQTDPLAAQGAPWSVSQTFMTEGTYKFRCAVHSTDFDHGMVGTVTVGIGGGATTTTTTATTTTTTSTSTSTTTQPTSTTPPPSSQPTDTVTNPDPSQTEQTTVMADRTAPAFTGKLKRRSARRALVLELGSSEPATLRTTTFRRAPGGRSFARIGQASLHVKRGRNVVRVSRATLRNGAYRVRLQLADAAGNRSRVKTLSFKIA